MDTYDKITFGVLFVGIIMFSVGTFAYVSKQNINVTATLASCTHLGGLTVKDSNGTRELHVWDNYVANNFTLIYTPAPDCAAKQVSVTVGTAINSQTIQMRKTNGYWYATLTLTNNQYYLTFQGHPENCTLPFGASECQ